MEIENAEIKNKIAKYRLKNWEVAKVLGIHDSNLSRLLRNKLLPKWESKIINAINLLIKEQENLRKDN